jgi:hypothetical protein
MLVFEKFSFQKGNKTMENIAILVRYFLPLREEKKKKGNSFQNEEMFGTEMPQLDCHNQYARTLI